MASASETGVREKVREVTDEVRNRVHDITEEVRGKVNHITDDVREKVEEVRGKVRRAVTGDANTTIRTHLRGKLSDSAYVDVNLSLIHI